MTEIKIHCFGIYRKWVRLLNEQIKEHLQKVKNEIVTSLESTFPNILVFEDEVPEEETKKYDDGAPYHLFVLKMGAFQKQANSKYLTQTFTVDYYSENRDDVDETTLDVIAVLTVVRTVSFADSDKFRARHANTNRFIDIVTMDFTRMTKFGC